MLVPSTLEAYSLDRRRACSDSNRGHDFRSWRNKADHVDLKFYLELDRRNLQTETANTMKAKLLVAWTWIQDHAWLAILAALALLVFFFVPQFKELAYGAFRVIIGIILVSIVLYAWFRDTIQQHIVSGDFVVAFRSLEAKHKVAVTITVIGLITWAVIECLVHP